MEHKMTDETTVLYLGGEGRSGSTVLSTILGSYDGVVAIGEVRNVWQALRNGELCGCMQPVSKCEFWTAVGDCAFGGWGRVDLDGMLRADERFIRHRSIPRHIVLRSRHDTPDLRAYREALRLLYDAIREVSGAPIIVDSTKRASYAFVLRDEPSLRLRVIHLIRDSRGVAYSNTKARIIKPEIPQLPGLEKPYMPTHPLWRTACDWEIKNLLFYLLGQASNRRRVKYEDLMTRPSEELGAIASFAGLDHSDCGTWDAETRSFESLPYHTVGGNPVRFRRGRVRLELDEEWRTQMSRGQKALVSAITYPLLLAYGYPTWAVRGKRLAYVRRMASSVRHRKA